MKLRDLFTSDWISFDGKCFIKIYPNKICYKEVEGDKRNGFHVEKDTLNNHMIVKLYDQGRQTSFKYISSNNEKTLYFFSNSLVRWCILTIVRKNNKIIGTIDNHDHRPLTCFTYSLKDKKLKWKFRIF
jgi:hypothetical protein